MKASARLWRSCVLATLALLAPASLSNAQTYVWNAGTGSFFTGSNWTPTGPPVDGSTAVINNGGTSNYTSGTLLLAALSVASTSGSSGSFAITGGDLTATGIKFGENGAATANVNNATLNAQNDSLFVGGQNGNGTGTLDISGVNAIVTSGDDIIFGRTGTGTLNMQGGYLRGGYTVVGKFGTGTWNHSGGVFEQAFGDVEIGDGGTPAQAGIAGPRTGVINLSGGVIQASGHVAIGNRVGGGTVNVSGGALDLTGDLNGTGTLFVGRGMDWSGNPGAGGAATFRVIGDDAVIAINGSFQMNPENVASSSTLVAQITGPTHSPINVTGDALISNGTFKVELGGYIPMSGDSWTILEAGADLSAEEAAIDAIVSAGGYNPIFHIPGSTIGTLQGPFLSTDFSAAPLTPGLSWNVGYADNKVTLSVTGTASFAADFNDDGKVDGADLTAWKAAFGTTAVGDADGDGDSDGADFLKWQQQFGSGVAAAPSVVGVPEPAAATLFGIALAAFTARRRGEH